VERKRAKAILEAILFTMGGAVEVERLAAVLELETETTREIIKEMQGEYEAEGRGIALLELEDSFQMCTTPDMYE
jgi:segregation and condensation protein B